MTFTAQLKRDHKEFKRLEKLFTDKPTLFGNGSCLYAVSKGMDGIDYIIGTANGVVSGSVSYADMGGVADKKYLQGVYERTSHKVGDVVTIAVTGSHKKGDEYVIVEVRGGGSNYVATLKGCKPYDPICTTTIGADEL